MSKPNLVETHPKKKKIIEALIKQKPYAEIEKEFDIPRFSLMKYVKKQLPAQIAKEQSKNAQGYVDIYLKQVDEITARCRKLFDACDEWLTDPDDPQKYSLDPRASEISVIYHPPGEEKQRKSAMLSELIDQLKTNLYVDPVAVRFKTADPRELILKTAESMKGLLELTAKITGDIKEITAKADIEHVIVPRIIQAVMINTGNAPEIQTKLVSSLEGIVDEYHNKIDQIEI